MPSMIDWVSADVRCSFDGVISDGQVLRVSSDGVIEWSTDARRKVEGSHASTVYVRGSGLDGVGKLEISGNPSKFLQGHNLFGSNDLRGLMPLFLDFLTSLLGLSPTDDDRASWAEGNYWLKRVDITRMYDLGNQDMVRRFLAACVPVAKGVHQSSSRKESTVYIGQHSKRKTLKFYNKLEELGVRGHRFHESIPVEIQQLLREYAAGCVRVEQTVRGMEIVRLGGGGNTLRRGTLWRPSMVEGLMSLYLEDIELNDTMKLNDGVISQLPGKLVAVYSAWRAGHDVRSLYSRPTFYRYRSQLLPFGVDIALVRPREIVAETEYLLGAPLKSFLAGEGKGVPSWAFGTSWLASVA